jgi:hypothetical protein
MRERGSLMENETELSELVKLLGHQDKREMFAATDILKYAGKTAVPALLEGLKNEDVHIRSRCAWVLGKMEEESAFEPIIEALSDPESKVRSFAAGALGKLKRTEAVPHLVNALGDENPSVRKGSAWALGKLGDSRAIRPLCALLRDTDPGVVKDVIYAIHKLEPRDERDVKFFEHCVGVARNRTKTSVSPGLKGKADLPRRTLKRWSEIIERRKEQEGDVKKFFAEQARERRGKEKAGNVIRKLIRLSNSP